MENYDIVIRKGFEILGGANCVLLLDYCTKAKLFKKGSAKQLQYQYFILGCLHTHFYDLDYYMYLDMKKFYSLDEISQPS